MFRFTLGLILLALISCVSKPNKILQASFDGFAGSITLQLYDNRRFDYDEAGDNYHGQFNIKGDTIFLNYQGKIKENPPKLFLIDIPENRIQELIYMADGKTILPQGFSLRIEENKLKYFE